MLKYKLILQFYRFLQNGDALDELISKRNLLQQKISENVKLVEDGFLKQFDISLFVN